VCVCVCVCVCARVSGLLTQEARAMYVYFLMANLVSLQSAASRYPARPLFLYLHGFEATGVWLNLISNLSVEQKD